MGYAFVFVVAAAVGVAVYVFTIREGIAPAIGPDPTASASGGGSAPAYVPVTGERPDWQSRLTGLLGLVVAIVVGGVALAATIYFVVSFLVGAIDGAVS